MGSGWIPILGIVSISPRIFRYGTSGNKSSIVCVLENSLPFFNLILVLYVIPKLVFLSLDLMYLVA